MQPPTPELYAPRLRLPTEILFKIVENLSDDKLALRSCSLVSSIFVNQCQSYLFRKISISGKIPASRMGKLHNLLEYSPHIVRHVRELELRGHETTRSWPFDERGFLSSILDILSGVQGKRPSRFRGASRSSSLNKIYLFRIDWSAFSQHQCISLLNVLSCKSITDITVQKNYIPAVFLDRLSPRLKSLHLYQVVFDFKSRETGSVARFKSARCRSTREPLSLHIMGGSIGARDANGFLKPPISRFIKMNYIHSCCLFFDIGDLWKHYQTFLRATSESLRDLSIILGHYSCTFGHVHLNKEKEIECGCTGVDLSPLVHLHHMKIYAETQLFSFPPSCIYWIASTLNQFSGPNELETISVHFRFHRDSRLSVIGIDTDWIFLSNVLDRAATFGSLRNFQFVVDCPSEGGKEEEMEVALHMYHEFKELVSAMLGGLRTNLLVSVERKKEKIMWPPDDVQTT